MFHSVFHILDIIKVVMMSEVFLLPRDSIVDPRGFKCWNRSIHPGNVRTHKLDSGLSEAVQID